MKMFTLTSKLIATGTLLLSCTAANAAIQSVFGSDFYITYDDSQTAALGLYGTPTISGDSIVFNPSSSFKAQGDAVSGELINSTLIVNLYSYSAITNLVLSESGTYQMNGDSSVVNAWGELQVVDMNTAGNVTPLFSTPNISNPDSLSHSWNESRTIPRRT